MIKISRRECMTGFMVLLVLLGVDALFKWVVYRYLESPIAVFQTKLGVDLWLQYVTNRGGAWGILAPFHTALLYFRLGVVAMLVSYLLFWNHSRLFRGALLLIIAGALGNICDCFFYGYVIDMIHFTFWGRSYGIFNLADAMICLGAGTLFIHLFRRERHDEDEESELPTSG